ncbi:MAG: ABC transporter ATP-binding protein [Bdellovibrionota bacterium]
MTSHHASGKVDETGRTTGDSSHNSSGPNSSFSSVQLVFRLLLGNLDGFRFQFYALAFVGFLDGAATFFVPVLLAEYTKTDFTRDRLLHLIPLIALLYLASHSLQWILRKFGEAFGPVYALHLRLKYFRRLEALPLQKLTEYHSGYLLSVVNTVVSGIGGLSNEVFWALARSASNLSLFFYFTAKESLGIAVLNLLILCAFVGLSMRFSRRMVPLASALNQQSAATMGAYADFGANLLTVKRLGVSDFAEKRLRAVSDETAARVRSFQSFHALRWFSLHNVFSLALLATISFLLMQISQGKISSAILILFVAAFTSVRMNAERLSENFKAILELDAYARQLSDVLATLTPSGDIPVASLESVELQQVTFHHAGSSVEIRVPEFRLTRGEKVAIVGESGQGKTTFLHLAANLYQPDSGERRLNGLPYGHVSPESFPRLFSMVSQEGELFHLTVRENLLLGSNMSESELLELLEELALGEWFRSLESGFEQIIGERGVTVSQGQKQRINLLRGYLQNRDIYLLDEPTSQLDERTELKVIDFIRRRLADKTIILVTHRPSLIDLCGRIFEITENRLTERVK